MSTTKPGEYLPLFRILPQRNERVPEMPVASLSFFVVLTQNHAAQRKEPLGPTSTAWTQ